MLNLKPRTANCGVSHTGQQMPEYGFMQFWSSILEKFHKSHGDKSQQTSCHPRTRAQEDTRKLSVYQNLNQRHNFPANKTFRLKFPYATAKSSPLKKTWRLGSHWSSRRRTVNRVLYIVILLWISYPRCRNSYLHINMPLNCRNLLGSRFKSRAAQIAPVY